MTYCKLKSPLLPQIIVVSLSCALFRTKEEPFVNGDKTKFMPYFIVSKKKMTRVERALILCCFPFNCNVIAQKKSMSNRNCHKFCECEWYSYLNLLSERAIT